MPDTRTLGETELVLNGLGLREATLFKVDVYVAGLYMPKQSSDPEYVLRGDVPKFLELHFVRSVSKGKQVDAFEEGFKKSADDYKAIEQRVSRVLSFMADVDKGEKMAFVYEPGKGTTFFVKGEDKGTIAGEDLQRALYAIYVGPEPPNQGLKEGLLGLKK